MGWQCDHRHITQIEGTFRCSDCFATLEDVAPGRIAEEQLWQQQAQQEDALIADHVVFSVFRAVTVRWLLAFTVAHNCWDWTTREVQAYIVKAATNGTRCRYVDLPHVRDHAGGGPADVFVSRARLSQTL